MSRANEPDPHTLEHHQELLRSLAQELTQTERSAEVHCAREADRLGQSGPAEALRAVASHATRTSSELRRLIREESLDTGGIGSVVGRLFSAVRDQVLDRVVDHERSYRGTLLGLRHGIDVVMMLRHVADSTGRVEIGGFCTRWLEEREPLVAQVAHAMVWFAHHPAAAIERATRTTGASQPHAAT